MPRIIPLLATAMSTTKKKKSKPIVQRNIPAHPSTTIINRNFTKRSTGIGLLSTTTVSSFAPLKPKATQEPSDDSSETLLYSDVDEELLEIVEKKRQRPSRSVNVSDLDPCLPFVSRANPTTDIVGGMASSSPGRVHG